MNELKEYSGVVAPNQNKYAQGINSASQFFSYYPKYEYLDKLISLNPKKNLNIFVDVKGCSPALYQEWAVRYIIENSKDRNFDMSIYSSVIDFIAFHKLYCQKRDLNIKIYFFMEQGKSVYHKKEYKDYKSNRVQSDFFGLDLADRELFSQVCDKNYEALEYTCNKIPNIQFYRLKYVEADFIPWYLMEYMIPKEDLDNSIQIIYTRDKDMLQCLKFPNTYQFYRGQWKEPVRMISTKSLLRHWAKTEEDVPCERVGEWFPLFLSMLGDMCDGVPGIKGVGYKSIINNLEAIKKVYGGDPDIMYNMVMESKDVLADSFQYVKNQTSRKMFGNQDIVKRNMKLISFRALSEWVNNDIDSGALTAKKYIEKVYTNTTKITDWKIIYNALKLKHLEENVNEESLERCFS